VHWRRKSPSGGNLPEERWDPSESCSLRPARADKNTGFSQRRNSVDHIQCCVDTGPLGRRGVQGMNQGSPRQSEREYVQGTPRRQGLLRERRETRRRVSFLNLGRVILRGLRLQSAAGVTGGTASCGTSEKRKTSRLLKTRRSSKRELHIDCNR